MQPSTPTNNSYFLGLITVFLMTFMDVFGRFAVVALHAAPSMYASLALFSASVTLLVIAGPGKLSLPTFKSLYTWLYAILQIAFAIAEVYTYSLSTTTQGNIMFRMIGIVSLISGWLLFGQKIYKTDFIGSLFIMAGAGYVAWTLPPDVRPLTLTALAMGLVLFDLRTRVAEKHDTSNQARNIKDQSRVTGIILFITSLLFMVMYGVVGWIVDVTGASTALPTLPSYRDFQNTPAVFGAILSGIFIISAAKYFYFLSVRRLGTEHYHILTAFVIPFTFGVEYLASKLNLMPFNGVGPADFAAGMLVTFASMYMVMMRRYYETGKLVSLNLFRRSRVRHD